MDWYPGGKSFGDYLHIVTIILAIILAIIFVLLFAHIGNKLLFNS
jgi:hypothetical protein